MNYAFPVIKHIDDVLPAVAGRDEFIVAKKDGYQVVNYAVMMEDSFPVVDSVEAALRRECRGLVFDLEGNLINRRFHKFFNVNERDETRYEHVDFSKPHVVLDKLDGSMVSPCIVNGHVRWMTKMGITDTAMQAETHTVRFQIYREFAEYMLKGGWTPIFEWVSRASRIVLDYPEDSLILTAIRNNETGRYLSWDKMIEYAEYWDMPLVTAYDYKDENILEIVRGLEDTEGVVIRFDDGHMLKVKADWYVLRHKSKDAITREKNVLDYIVNEKVDDVLPFLQAEDQSRLLKFQDEFWVGFNNMVAFYEGYCEQLSRMDRKEWAVKEMPERKQIDPHLPTVVFGWYDNKPVRDTLLNIVRKSIGTQVKINQNRYLWGGSGWSYNFDGDA
jgi:RNA ligase